MDRDNKAPSNKYTETGRQRFFLGDSDSDDSDFDNDEPKRRFSGSDCSSVVGGPPTNLDFIVDDDSGIGMSMDGSSPDDEFGPESTVSSADQIIPMPAMNIGANTKSSANDDQQKCQRRSRKYRFNDFYQLQDDHLGSGAYASVCTCISLTSGKEFAVKLVNKHEPGHTRSRILREVDIFKMCKGHPNFVQLIEWFEDDDHFYMVFEKMYGGPLLNHIQRKVCFTEQEASMVARDIAMALKFLHSKGVAHRDLKPENVLCTELDRVSPVKLCDFDLASKPSMHSMKRRASRQLHNVQSEPDLASPVGSAEFLAPEVVETFVGESLKYDRRCDLWSLGVIIYIMLCGYVPFYGECDREDCGWNQGKPCDDCQENLFEKIQQGSFEFPDEEWRNISDEAKDLISHLLVKNVKQRFTASAVLEHPWISSAPETPLHTPNNLFRNTSSKDIQQFNDHFNFAATRLSSRVEEVIPSLGSTPENESAFGDALSADLTFVDDIVSEAKHMLISQADSGTASNNGNADDFGSFSRPYDVHKVGSAITDNNNDTNQPQLQGPYANAPAGMHPPQYYCPPPMINMNGTVIFAPAMASPNPQVAYIQQQQQPYYNQYAGYPQNEDPRLYDFPAGLNEHYQQGYAPPAPYDCSAMRAEDTKMSFNPAHLNSSAKMAKQGSLSTAISQLGLETCQNAIVRQNSSGKEMHAAQQSREAQVNV